MLELNLTAIETITERGILFNPGLSARKLLDAAAAEGNRLRLTWWMMISSFGPKYLFGMAMETWTIFDAFGTNVDSDARAQGE